MSGDLFYNPEPPPEIVKIQNEDLIGNTLFSKHWLFELLLKLIKKVEEEVQDDVNNDIENDMNDENKLRQLKLYDSSNFKELDPDFEKDLCELWDMSVEKDVCMVLDEFNSIQIFEGYIRKFDNVYPRAVEILIGIFVNMASLSDTICLKLVSKKTFIQYLLFNILSQMADVPTMCQCVRLFNIFLTNNATNSNEKKLIKQMFIDYLKNELIDQQISSATAIDASFQFSLNWQGIIEKFYFILEQSLNPILLDNTCLLLFNLVDNDDQILNAFTFNHRIVDAVCNAALTRTRLDKAHKTFVNSKFTTTRRESDKSQKRDESNKEQTPLMTNSNPTNSNPSFETQISEDDISTIDHLFLKYFMCLQILSTCESGVVALLDRSHVVIELFDEYLDKCFISFNDWEISSSHSLNASVNEESLKNLTCLLSILNCIFPDNQSAPVLIDEYHKKYPRLFFKLITLCNFYLKFINENKNKKNDEGELDEDLETAEHFNLAKASMFDLFSNLIILKENNDANLNRLINETIHLLHE